MHGREIVPQKGGVLIVGNHSSWIDIPIVVNAVKRRFWFVSGDFILKNPIMATMLKHLCVIRLSKKNSKQGIDETVEKLKAGEAVCIFPEGELTKTGEMQRFRNGVVKIQQSANVPVIPFHIDGAFDVWSKKQTKQLFFKKIKIHFGKPFMPSAQGDAEIAAEIKSKVEELIC
ncbi:MAG: 1-acyl-sn-glycerol-3-phosphate acyltransferase [bacterium]|nr:1-acyl-sn-glycerol-3-phosphate acyltransferase [bacterium]